MAFFLQLNHTCTKLTGNWLDGLEVDFQTKCDPEWGYIQTILHLCAFQVTMLPCYGYSGLAGEKERNSGRFPVGRFLDNWEVGSLGGGQNG